MHIIGIAHSAHLTDRLYRDGAFEFISSDPADLIEAALHDAGIAPGPHVALVLIGVLPVAWAGPVQIVESAGKALRWAQANPARVTVIAEMGVGAVVLADSGKQIYAEIERLEPDVMSAMAAIDAHDIGYLEFTNLNDPAELGAILTAYRSPDPGLTCAIGSTSGLGALITAALAVYHHFLPALPDWDGPADPTRWQGSPFYAVARPKTWFLDAGQTVRRAAINTPDAHVVLVDHPTGQPRPNTFLRESPLKLFIITADDTESLRERLRTVDERVRQGVALDDLAADLAAAYTEYPGSATVALLGRDHDDVLHEINSALRGISDDAEWFTPRGSYYTPRPLGQAGKIAFVYPGAFNSYPRMAQDVLFMCPDVHHDLAGRIPDLGSALGDRWLYARSLEKLTRRHWSHIRQRLEERPATMIEAGITASVIFTHMMRDVFDIQPDVAFGYSVGETSMFYALDVWRDTEAAHATLHESPLYRERLCGPKNAAREMWGLLPETPDDFWGVYFIAAPVDEVRAAAQVEPRVFVTHINTPVEVVIAGEAAACQRVVESLGANAVRAVFDMIIHCDVTFLEYDRFHELHDHPVHPSSREIAFYSAAEYAPVPLDQGVLAHAVSRMTCKALDFPRLVNRVYDDGARIFIELGPRSTCARWISDTLGDRAHLSVSINQLSVDDHTALLKLLAQLVSHGVPLNLSALYDIAQQAPPPAAHDMPYTAVTQAHTTFLEVRLDGLRMLGDLLEMQAGMIPAEYAPVVAEPKAQYTRRPAIFDERALEEFATGSIKACFGPEYAVYDNRRAPRIPNGDLLLIGRIVEIDAERYALKPGARMVSEYDVPVHPWFYRDNAYPSIPYSVYMEMALQLCGVLSAYLGSSLTFPDLDFYFRNLDGEGTLHADLDLRGKTITNRVSMTSSITLQGIIMQKFTFALESDGAVFYEGEASFGFFTAQAMANQTGLDKGQPTQPWYQVHQIPAAAIPNPQRYYQANPGQPHYRLAAGQLDLLDQFVIVPDSGKYNLGYIYASKYMDSSDWFFNCHFYEDPVMPGSLGVEALLQAMQAFALEQGLGAAFESPHFEQATAHKIVWHYRGQVTRQHSQIGMEIHIKHIEETADTVTIIGDASLWRDDGLRIYEVLDIALCVKETR